MPSKGRFEIKKSFDEKYYFVLIAKNQEIIATSQRYSTKQNCQKGIESVISNSKNADIVDTTLKNYKK